MANQVPVLIFGAAFLAGVAVANGQEPMYLDMEQMDRVIAGETITITVEPVEFEQRLDDFTELQFGGALDPDNPSEMLRTLIELRSFRALLTFGEVSSAISIPDFHVGLTIGRSGD